MKRKDFFTIILIVGVSAFFAFIICSQFIKTPKEQQRVEVIESISADFPLPDPKIFNTNAVNPTKLIEIGPNKNNRPFAN